MNPIAALAKRARIALGRLTSEPDLAILSLAQCHPQSGVLGPYVDKGGGLIGQHGGKSFSENFVNLDTTDQVAILTATGLVRATTADLLHHLYTPSGKIFGVCALGAGQTLPPVIVANGLNIGGDQVSTEGYEIFSHFAGATGRPFVVGYDPAFYFKAKVLIADISGTDTLLIGFRRAEVNNATLASYADYAGIGFNTAANPGAIKLIAEVNGSAPTDFPVTTTQTLADATALTVQVNVSAAGAVTFKLLVGSGVLAAPTVTAAMSFDDGDPVIPFMHFLNSADLAGEVAIQTWEAGYQ